MTITAVTVSWFGVRLGIAPALTDEPPVAIDVNRRYTEIRFGLAGTASPAGRLSPSASPSKARPSRTSAAPAPSRTPTSRPVATTPASVTPSASPSPSEPDRRPRYEVTADGGTVTVAYSSARVDAVSADPLTGYTVTTARRSDIMVVVRLSGPGHTSEITAYWDDGPAARIIEEYGS